MICRRTWTRNLSPAQAVRLSELRMQHEVLAASLEDVSCAILRECVIQNISADELIANRRPGPGGPLVSASLQNACLLGAALACTFVAGLLIGGAL